MAAENCSEVQGNLNRKHFCGYNAAFDKQKGRCKWAAKRRGERLLQVPLPGVIL